MNKRTPKPTPKPYVSTEEFKLRIRQLVTGTKPFHAHVPEAEREVQPKGTQ